MTSSEAAQHKSQLRKEIMAARRAQAAGHFCEDAHDENLVYWLADQGYRRIAAYVSTDDEPSTEMLLEVCAEVGVRVWVPRVAGDELEWVEFDWDALEEGPFGIPQPIGPSEPLDVEAMIIPAVACAHDGTRLGRGKGFYDRALSNVPKRVPIIALVHDEELYESLPSEAHDRKVDWVSTCSALLEVE